MRTLILQVTKVDLVGLIETQFALVRNLYMDFGGGADYFF